MTVVKFYNTDNTLTTVLFVVFLVLSGLACSVQIPNGTPALAPAVTATSTVVVTQEAVEARVTASRSLNVRKRAGAREPVVGYLWFGERVELTGNCARGWAEITWESGLAWVNSKYLSDNYCKE
jgi:uncharacterized protein YgiM (DUF1202 family)